MRAPTTRPLPPARSTTRAIGASIASMFFVALVSATPASPFHPVLPEEPGGPLRWISDLIGLGNLSTMGLVFVGLLATATAAIAFLLVLREAWHGRITLRTVLLLALGYHLAVLMLPLLFSRDVYSYAYYGRIVSTYGSNPYVATPLDFPLNSLFDLTWPGWRGTPSVYGPLFTWMSAFLTSTTKSIPSLITSFQLLAGAASLGTAALLARTAQRVRPERAVFAAAVVGLNPIVVFHVVGGGHNDMLVALAIAAAAAALFSGHRLTAAILLGLGMSVKATAVVPLLLLLVAVAASAPPDKRRRELLAFCGIVGGGWLVLALPFLQLTNPTLGLFGVAGNDSWMAPGQLVVQVGMAIGSLVAGDAGADVGAIIARLSLFALSVTGVLLIARQLWRRPDARTPAGIAAAWAWALLIVILPSPVLFTWYLVWILPLAWVLPKIPRRALVLLSASFILTQVVTESTGLPEFLQTIKLPFGHPIAIAVLIWVGRDFVHRLRAGTLLHIETGSPAFGDAFEEGPAVIETIDGSVDVRTLRTPGSAAHARGGQGAGPSRAPADHITAASFALRRRM